MMTGVVTPTREVVIRVTLRGPGGKQLEIDAGIDTGFPDFLTLPTAQIAALALPLGGSMRVTLADGSKVELDVYTVEVMWDGQWRSVSVLEANGGPLVGMSLLYGYDLRVQVVDGGLVTIDRLTTSP
jgi:clan AA aspartic protease